MAPHILILRDPRESARKCSLTPLRGQEGVKFVPYAANQRLDAGGRILLCTDGELLSEADSGRDLFLIDCNWRKVDKLRRTVDGDLIPRRLPPLKTAYPRTSKGYEDPAEGLASIEALYAATALMGEPNAQLLEAYRWREEFLAANPDLPR